jgi:hypothetical protein
MDKPVPGWLIVFTIIVLVSVSVVAYFWLKSLVGYAGINENKKKDENDNS